MLFPPLPATEGVRGGVGTGASSPPMSVCDNSLSLLVNTCLFCSGDIPSRQGSCASLLPSFDSAGGSKFLGLFDSGGDVGVDDNLLDIFLLDLPVVLRSGLLLESAADTECPSLRKRFLMRVNFMVCGVWCC